MNKSRLILHEGSPVRVTSARSGEVTETTALVGRATKQFDNTISLETNRRGHFLPQIQIENGDSVVHLVTGDNYLVIATMSEVMKATVVANIGHLYICNCSVSVLGVQESADNNGNRINMPVQKVEGQRAYIQTLNAQLKQYDVGLHPDAEYKLFLPRAPIDLMDRVMVTEDEVTIDMKVVATDFLSYKGLVVVQVKTETRV
jgi:hypothetical protein